MMNQGESLHTVVSADPGSAEKHHLDANHGQAIQYYSPANVAAPVSWPPEGTRNSSLPNSAYQYNHQIDASLKDVNGGSNAISHGSTSSHMGVDSGSQVYMSYASYPAANTSYGYGTTGYQGYYDGYQQPSNQQYTQTVGVYQNTGAPYQPLSSFQNTGSYAGSASYSSTYCNPGDYQTSGAYAGSNYSNSTDSWNQGTYANYSHQYSNYNQDSSSSYTSTPVVASTSSYQPEYSQWANYYNETEVICAPGTENPAVTTASTVTSSMPSVSVAYTAPTSQPQPSFAPPWRTEYANSVPSTFQTTPAVGTQDGYMKHRAQGFQNYHPSTAQPNMRQPLDTKPLYPNVLEPQQSPLPQGPSTHYAGIHQGPQTYQPSPQPPSVDTHRVSNLQIPTNPRIASNIAPGLTRTAVVSSATHAAATRPAYTSVSKPKDERLLDDPSNSMLKAFPPSLRGYVERALARCKGERQMAASQDIMKQIITKATADNSLYTRDWDTEPLFPLPDASAANENLHSTAPVSLMSMFRRSPSKRSKSRWEPLPEEKPMEKSGPICQSPAKFGSWSHFNGNDKKFTGGKFLDKDVAGKFGMSGATTASTHRPAKKQRFGNELNMADDVDTSSDSDKEQGRTSYYSGAITLANTPEERKKRESRSKRFEKGGPQRAEMSNPTPKAVGANLYARRASAMAISRAAEDSSSTSAVEDIDWDSLTVKGTSQELEKRYLRLTSAPDPATVRPEEVLERALLMVKNSQKSYLYKCDQLKAIRQDLTVQRIRNEMTVRVYETHARLALEYGDLPEYNQCQSQLKSLYAEGIVGRYYEFSAYNLLAVIFLSKSRRDLLASMSRLSGEAKRDEAVKHALAVQAAVTSGNYVLFFRLYKTSPNLNSCLMDLYVEKMRFEAVKCMSRAYRPTVPISYVACVLGFNSTPAVEGCEEKEEVLDECAGWLRAHGACIITDNEGELQFDTKASSSTLCMPEPEDAVAHGDANLAVDNFFTRTPT